MITTTSTASMAISKAVMMQRDPRAKKAGKPITEPITKAPLVVNNDTPGN